MEFTRTNSQNEIHYPMKVIFQKIRLSKDVMRILSQIFFKGYVRIVVDAKESVKRSVYRLEAKACQDGELQRELVINNNLSFCLEVTIKPI